MKILGIIPARYASTRYPGKPLVTIAGKTMIARVYAQCKQAAGLADVVVATDDARIYDEVKRIGGDVYMTQADHPTGTDRLIEVSKLLPGYDAYVNIQGDEPFIAPGQIDAVCEALANPGVQIATLVKPITDAADLSNPNVVKVVLGTAANGVQRALYFSRSAIPHVRTVSEVSNWLGQYPYVKHIGIYGFGADVLPRIASMQQGALERAESLEQLRWLENGLDIVTRKTEAETYAIDTPEDLARIEALIANGVLR